MAKRNIKRSNETEEITLAAAFEDFIQEKEARNISAPTLRNYKQSFTLFCKFYSIDENTPAHIIAPSHIFKYMNTLRNEDVQPTSINHYLRDLRAFFYWCMEACRSYIKPFKIEMMKVQEGAPKHFEDSSLESLLEKPKGKADKDFTEWRNWVIVCWIMATGNRAATVCDVRIGDIDYQRKEIVLRHTKNKKASVIPLSDSLAAILKEYIKLWRNGARSEEYLFPSITAEQLTTDALRHSFSKFCRSRGVEQTNIHGLRHNFAKNWVQTDGNTFQLQRVLGHSSLTMTQHYVRLYGEDLKQGYEEHSLLDNLRKTSSRSRRIAASR